MRIRIAVANIQSGIGVTRGYRQYVTSGWRYFLPHAGRGLSDAGAFLLSEEADIALLTEVGAARGVSQLNALAKDARLEERAFFPTRKVGVEVREGSAILSSFPFRSTASRPLMSRVNPRVLGEATIELEGRTVTLLVAHLALGAKWRAVQMLQLAARVKEIDGPVILGGDFNERDARAFKPLVKAGLSRVAVPNYPSWKPRHALQGLFVSNDFNVIEARVPDGTRFSDHLPLVVEVEL